MFTTIFAFYLLSTFISLIFYPTQTLGVTNMLSASVYGAVNGSSQTDETIQDNKAVDCKKGYQPEGNKCVFDCASYYDRINSKCTDTWVGDLDKNSSNPLVRDNTTIPRLGNLNFTESKK